MAVAHILRQKGTSVFTVEPGDSVQTIVDMLARHRIGAVVVVDAAGSYTLKMQDLPQQKVDAAVLAAKVSAFVKNNPDVAVFVAGDRSASYDTVYQAMVLLQQAGVEKVGLMSNSAD